MKKHVLMAVLIGAALLSAGCSQKKETEKATEASTKAATEAAAGAAEAAGDAAEAASEAAAGVVEAASEAAEAAAGAVEDMSEAAAGVVEDMSEAAAGAVEAASEAGEAAVGAVEDMSEAAADAVEETSEAAADAAEAVSEAAAGVVEESSEAASEVSELITENSAAAETELMTEELTEAPAEIVTEAVTEAPVTEIVTEAATEAPATEIVTEAVTEAPATEIVTEAVTEAPETEIVTEAATEAPETEVATEAATEEETEAVTEAAVEEVTEEVTEAVTEAAVEEATEAVTEETTEAEESALEEAVTEGVEPMSEEAEEITIKELGDRPDYKALDYVQLGTYKGLPVTLEEVSVSEEEVDAQINSAIEAGNLYDLTEEGVVKNGDIANIDFVGKLDGEAFDGGTAQDYDLTIGSHSFIEGFEEGLEGVAIGDTVDLPMTFPEDYFNSDLAGKEVVFTVTVNAVKSIPELTDELAQKLSGEDDATVDSYRASVKEDLLQQAEEAQESQVDTELMTQLYNTCTVDEYPQELVDYSVQQMINFYADYAQSNGMEFSDFVEQYFGIDISTFKSEAEEAVKQSLQQEMILKAIAEQEKMEVSDEEFEEECSRYAEGLGYDSVDDFKSDYDDLTIRSSILMDKAKNFVVDNAMITYTEPETEEALQEAVTEAVTE